jgi:hypothetical protein
MGEAKKPAFGGVLVTAGGVEYGSPQPETITAISINVEAINVPRFRLAICISSTQAKVLMMVAHPI